MVERKYKYKDFVEKQFGAYYTIDRWDPTEAPALNDWDFISLFQPSSFSLTFTKHVLPQSLCTPPQTLSQWHHNLTSGFVAQNYKSWKASVSAYWEDEEKRSAMAWCTEKGILLNGEEYEMDYMMRYEFDGEGRLESLWEYTDSKFQEGIMRRWLARTEGEGKVVRAHDRFYLITYPRSASNLLVKILALEEQPNVKMRENGGYFFLPPVLLMAELKLRGKNVEEWTKQERDRMMKSYQECFEDLEEHVRTAKAEGKIVFVKEHSTFMTEPTAPARFLFGEDRVKEAPWTVGVSSAEAAEFTHSRLNETVLSDEFLRTWLPTFLIRHPALVFPSHYRTMRDLEGVEAAKTADARLTLIMTLHWTRTLYDWYSQELSKSESAPDSEVTWPLVLDADDIMTDPKVLVRFCEIVGLDPAKLRFTWMTASKDEFDQIPTYIEKRMRSTLLASAGVMGGKTAINLDIEMEAEKWREEFGEHEGEKIEKLVRAAMPDYEFMKAKRLRRKTPV